uniref:C3H1-type domain-containing protein n=1 Tax=Kalanchoe fedtschenkoi TaxID=63787 RepID=A0A7N0UYY3_KALFE
MGYGGESGFGNGNVVQIVTGGSSWDSGVAGNFDQAVWATDEEYTVWNGQQSQARLGSEPANKKARSSQPAESLTGRAKAIGKMFFKTKLCCKFRVGTCPYVTNCNFAHSLEELRKPPPNWQDIVAAHDGEKKVLEPREEFKIPSVVSTDFSGDGSRSSRGRHCKKFYTAEGCPYGDSCTYIHDEHSRARESVAISLNTGGSGGGGGGSSGGGGAGGSTHYGIVVGGGPQNLKPANWKTKICNKWEMTGFCPFGSKCHFAHGAAGVPCFTIPPHLQYQSYQCTVLAIQTWLHEYTNDFKDPKI